jgi:hypothetical protein
MEMVVAYASCCAAMLDRKLKTLLPRQHEQQAVDFTQTASGSCVSYKFTNRAKTLKQNKLVRTLAITSSCS